MIHTEIYLSKYRWHANIFIPVDKYDEDAIYESLEDVGCSEDVLGNVGKINSGMTYSNTHISESVVVIGMASIGDEYANTIAHEIAHLATHISIKYGVELGSEEYCSLIGDIAMELNHITKNLVSNCKCARKMIESIVR